MAIKREINIPFEENGYLSDESDFYGPLPFPTNVTLD
jgi:hypothetical protein